MRNFHADFLRPALSGLSESQKSKIALALDTAILFGVLEYQQGNQSFVGVDLEPIYAEKVARLKKL